MKHQKSRQILAERVADLLTNVSDLSRPARPYQVSAFEKIGSWLSDRKAARRGHVVHATGLGKTFLFSALLKHCYGLHSLVIVPTKVLLQQTAGKIAFETGGMLGHLSSVSRVVDGDGEVIAVRGHDKSDIVIATNASFARHAEKLAGAFNPNFIVWDECHWGYTKRMQNALAMFPESVTLGFTATPDFLGSAAKGGYVPVEMDSGVTLYGDPSRFARSNFGDEIDNLSVRWGIENGWLSPLAWGRIEFDISLDGVPIVDTDHGLDYDAISLQKLMAKHWDVMRDTVCRLFDDSQYDLARRQTFAVCPGVEEAEDLTRALRKQGIPSACISSHTSDPERLAILDAYNRREIRHISSIMVLREGWDAPVAEVGMILRPTRSRVAYVQTMGRPLRPTTNGHKKVALILDAHFAQSKNDPLSVPVIFGKDRIAVGGIICGPKGPSDDEDVGSPYLPKHAKPQLVVMDALSMCWVNYARRDGTFITRDGRLWANNRALRLILKLSDHALNTRLARGGIETIERTVNRNGPFYLVSAVKDACKDLLEIEVRAGSDGIALHLGKKWAPINVCAKLLSISRKSLIAKTKKVKIEWVWGRNRWGRKFRFFSVEEVRAQCKGLSEDRTGPRQKKAGVFTYEGKKLAPLEECSRIFSMDNKALLRVVRCYNVPTVRGTDTLGRGRTFYSVSDFEDALEGIPNQDPESISGVYLIKGVKWVNRVRCRHELGLGVEELNVLLSKYKGPIMLGRQNDGGLCDVYRIDMVSRLKDE